MLSSSEITTTAATAAVSSSLVVDPSSTSTTTAVKGSSQQQQQQQEKPLKMNTYIQLEIDQSNFNCLPRVCKFCVSKLTLMDGSASSSSSNTNHHSHHHHHHHHHSSSHSSHHHNTPLNSSASSTTSASTSVILAVKLQGSKRSFRTIEIPMHKTQTTTTDQSPAANNPTNDSKQLQQSAQFTSVDLNLNYNITYPHFIKKDTNVLYFYIQKKKKYKTKTILGNFLLFSCLLSGGLKI